MIKRGISFLVFGILLLMGLGVFAAGVVGCGRIEESTSSTTVYTYQGAQSPGDVWSWQIDRGGRTFIATNETTSFWASGTLEVLVTSFLKLYVNNSNDSSAVGQTAHALELPGTFLIAKPAGSRTNEVNCVAKGTTAPDPGSYNLVVIPSRSWTSREAAYATMEVSLVSGGTYSFNYTSYRIDGVALGVSTEAGYTFDSSSGRFIKSGVTTQFFVTASGAFVGDFGPGRGGFLGLKRQTVDVSDFARSNFRVIQSRYNPPGRFEETSFLSWQAHPTLANHMIGNLYTNIETGAILETVTATGELTAQDSQGFFTITQAGETAKMIPGRVGSSYMGFIFLLSRYQGVDRFSNFKFVQL